MFTLNEEMISNLPKDRLVKAVVITKTATALLEFSPSVSFSVPLAELDLEFESGDRLKVNDDHVIAEVIKTDNSTNNKKGSGRSPLSVERSW